MSRPDRSHSAAWDAEFERHARYEAELARARGETPPIDPFARRGEHPLDTLDRIFAVAHEGEHS